MHSPRCGTPALMGTTRSSLSGSAEKSAFDEIERREPAKIGPSTTPHRGERRLTSASRRSDLSTPEFTGARNRASDEGVNRNAKGHDSSIASPCNHETFGVSINGCRKSLRSRCMLHDAAAIIVHSFSTSNCGGIPRLEKSLGHSSPIESDCSIPLDGAEHLSEGASGVGGRWRPTFAG